MRHMVWWGAWLVLLLGWPAQGRAETAVLKPLTDVPGGGATDARAQASVKNGLEDAHIRVLSEADVKARLAAAADKPCLDIDCAGSVLDVVGADMLVAVVVGRKDGKPVDVLVGMVDMAGQRVYGNDRILGEDVERAARAAFQRALSKWPARGLIPVRVIGKPTGATVLVDGQPRGVLPIELRVQPGKHTISVSMEGYGAAQQVVDITAGPDDSYQLPFALQPDLQALHRNELRRRRTAIALMGTGAGAVVLGAVYTGFAIRAHTQGGECAEPASVPAPCKREYLFHDESRARLTLGLSLAAVGAAALTTGTVMFLKHKRALRVDASAGPSHAFITLRRDF